MAVRLLITLLPVLLSMPYVNAQMVTTVGFYRTFERSIEYNKPYANKFYDVEVKCSFISPSGKITNFLGFFDGDG